MHFQHQKSVKNRLKHGNVVEFSMLKGLKKRNQKTESTSKDR